MVIIVLAACRFSGKCSRSNRNHHSAFCSSSRYRRFLCLESSPTWHRGLSAFDMVSVDPIIRWRQHAPQESTESVTPSSLSVTVSISQVDWRVYAALRRLMRSRSCFMSFAFRWVAEWVCICSWNVRRIDWTVFFLFSRRTISLVD